MAKNRKQLIHLHTPEVKMPEKDLLNLGEIAVQHNDAEAALYIQKNNGDIAKFIDATAVDAKIEVEKFRAEGAEGTLNGKIETLTSAVTDNEKVVATALNQIVKSVGLDENGNSPLPQNISLTDAIKDVTNKVSTLEGSNHTHANKDVLDGITAEKVTAWSAAEANAKKYVDGKVDGKFDAKGTAAKALENAKGYADSKAASALTDAKSYADGLNTAMDGRVDVLEASSHTHDNKGVLDGITAVKVAAWDAAEANAKADAADKYQVKGEYEAAGAAAQALVDAKSYADGLAVNYDAAGAAAQALSDAKSYADGLNTAMDGRVKGVESTISTLVGEDTGKSVRSVSAEEVAKIVNSADTRYDTLKEIADWIISDTTGSAQMANDISALKAISAGTRLDTLESKSHSHNNKNLLDTYTQTESNLADAVAKKHEHTNKGVLDGITDVKVAAWDAAEGKAKAYVDSKVDGKFDNKGAAAQALKDAKAYADGKADKVHTHAIADVTDLQDALDGKAASTHAHAIADVTGLQGALDGKAASAHTHAIVDVTGLQDALDGKAASAHTHAIADVNGLQNALDGKAASAHTHAIADVTGLQDALDGKDSQGAAAKALIDAKAYTDEKLIKIDCGTY